MASYTEIEYFDAVVSGFKKSDMIRAKKDKIVIHLTDIPLTQNYENTFFIGDYLNYFEDPFARSHFCVGYLEDEVTAMQLIPVDYIGYNVCGNGDLGTDGRTTIDIVVCVPREYDFIDNYKVSGFCLDEKYFNAVYQTLIELISDLMILYGIKIENVMFHKEVYLRGYAAKKPCVSEWFKQMNYQFNWDSFRKDIILYMKENNIMENISPSIYGMSIDDFITDGVYESTYSVSLDLDQQLYRLVTPFKPHPDMNLEKRLFAINKYDFMFSEFDGLGTYQLFAHTSESKVKEVQKEFLKYGYTTYITTDIPYFDYLDQRRTSLNVSNYRLGTYIISEDTIAYKDPLHKIKSEVIIKGSIYRITDSDDIINGCNESWIYDKESKMYVLIKQGAKSFVTKIKYNK